LPGHRGHDGAHGQGDRARHWRGPPVAYLATAFGGAQRFVERKDGPDLVGGAVAEVCGCGEEVVGAQWLLVLASP
jgi:hypothetical protein